MILTKGRIANLVPAIALVLAGISPLVPLQAQSTAASARQEVPWLYKGSDVPVDTAWLFGTLDNGLRYAIRDNGVPPGQVSIRVRVDAGSLMEENHELGFAHFLEHLTFRGSKYVPDGEAKRVWQRLGATFGSDSNAQTTPTGTVYRLDLPDASQDGLDESMKILAGMIAEPTINDASVNSERAVIMAEQREGYGPQVRIADATRALFFAGQRLATHSPIGTTQTLQSATAKDLRAFHDRWYRPENVVISIAGDGDPKVFETYVRKYFGGWKGKGKAQPIPDFGKPNGDLPTSEVLVEPGLPAMLSMAYLRPWVLKNDTIIYNQERLTDMLALQMINRRLEARARAGGSYLQASVSQDDVSRSVDGTFISVLPLGEDWAAALNDVRAVIEDAKASPPSQAEIDREYNEFESLMAISVENKDTEAGSKQADDIVGAVDIRETVASPETALKIFRDMKPGLTPQKLLESTRRMFTGVAMRSILTLPAEQKDAEAKLALALASPVEPAKDVRLSGPAVTADALPKLGPPGTVTSRETLSDLDIEMVSYSNGVKLSLFANAAEKEKIRVNIRFGRGYQAFSPTKPVPSWAAGYALMPGGVGDLGQEELDRLTTSRRIGMQFAIDDDAFEMSAITRSADLKDQLHLLAAKLAYPRWDAAPVERMKAGMLAGYDGLSTSPDGVMGRELGQLLRNGDVRWRTPSKEEIAALTPEAFRATWEPLLKSGPIEVQIYGDIDADQAIKLVGQTFGALPPREDVPVNPAYVKTTFPAHNDAPVVMRHNGAKDQAAAVMAWPTAGGFADARESRQLEILTQVFNDRLFEGLRSQDGAAYSPSVDNSWPFSFDNGGYISVTSQLKPEKISYFFTVINRIAADLAANPVSADELQRTVAPMRQLLARASTGNAFWMSQMEGASYDKRRLIIMRSMPRDLLQVTPADIQALAKKYLVADKSWTAVVLPKGVEAE
ncbi:M16 family metallopeptidase [Rhizorhapis sp. SPR117]|uniref:M16 family metallopeptidase n=1 Tax=Rhizorhapis sp. SPR117 TaxID=2912611 RepID=UPI001F3D78DC|nr:insulinase family protein [Rhizorhapis sp. SPR117]